MNNKKYILPIIVLSQFCCTSLWFAGNGVMDDLIITYQLSSNALGHLTVAVQLGFILGSLLLAILTIADRYPPSKVFLSCALLGALFNLGIIWDGNTLSSILTLRFITGFFLAGIYPVGMKIAADYYKEGLGKSMGLLVGALVIGTAFPHLTKGITDAIPWKLVLAFISLLAAGGGVLMLLLVPNGPYRKKGTKLALSSFFKVFKNAQLRSASFGYFGHMWELYAFWTFVPIILQTYATLHPSTTFNIPLLSFLIVAIGGLASVFSGYLSQKAGTKKTASIALLLSCTCCLVSPFLFMSESKYLFVGFMLCWGIVVVADSPLFSTLVAQNAKPEIKGTALTIVNCIGFFLTIISIQLLNILQNYTNLMYIYTLLAIGPILGLLALGTAPKANNNL